MRSKPPILWWNLKISWKSGKNKNRINFRKRKSSFHMWRNGDFMKILKHDKFPEKILISSMISKPSILWRNMIKTAFNLKIWERPPRTIFYVANLGTIFRNDGTHEKRHNDPVHFHKLGISTFEETQLFFSFWRNWLAFWPKSYWTKNRMIL